MNIALHPGGNFARDFGERFVPAYKPTSMVDYLLNSPFKD
jgi:hypothetical protein